jgi:hypothetical protein
VILPIVLIGTGMFRAMWGLRYALGISYRRAAYALTLWFALTWVVALACVQAVTRKRGVFLRTPKSATNAVWVRALQAASLETVLGAACVVGAAAAVARSPSVLSFGLAVILLAQSVIYLSAPSHSLLSLEVGARAAEPDRAAITGTYANESRLGLQIGVIAVLLGLVALAASLWPAPNHTPWWYQYINPQPLVNPVVLPGSHLPDPTQTLVPTPGGPTFTPEATEPPAATNAPAATQPAQPGPSATPTGVVNGKPTAKPTKDNGKPTAPATVIPAGASPTP